MFVGSSYAIEFYILYLSYYDIIRMCTTKTVEWLQHKQIVFEASEFVLGRNLNNNLVLLEVYLDKTRKPWRADVMLLSWMVVNRCEDTNKFTVVQITYMTVLSDKVNSALRRVDIQ